MTRILLLIPLLCLSLPAQKAAPEPGATLTINSEPDGAKVLLDRVEVGATPLTLAVTPVPHLLALQKPGFKETFQTVKPLPNAPTLVNIRLEPVVAWVLLHSEPQGADVTDADGNIALGATPALVKVETPAVKSFTFALAGYQKQTIRLPVEDATPLVKTVALVSDSGTLK
ncbi:MAG: PEGA domain-containing protein, partial [Kiritimatiellaeota bacterium]|nr:PEGA domain-containing protein [Kiritimatiellota bacterium]